MSTIDFQCPGCARRFSVPIEQAGKKGGCRHCNIFFLIPAATPAAPGAATPAPIPPAAPPEPLPPPETESAPQAPEPPPLYIPDRPTRAEPRRLAFREPPAPPPAPQPASDGGGSRVWISLVVMGVIAAVRFGASQRNSSHPTPTPNWEQFHLEQKSAEQRRAEHQQRIEQLLRDARRRQELSGSTGADYFRTPPFDSGIRIPLTAPPPRIGPDGKPEPQADAIRRLIGEMKDKDPKVSVDAQFALAQHGEPAVPALIEVLSDPKNGLFPRASACDALGFIGSKAAPAVPALTEALADREKYLRVHAGMALGFIGPEAKSAVPAMLDAMKASPGYGAVFADAFGGIGPDAGAAVPALTELLADSRPRTRESAVRALRRIGPAAAAPAIPALTNLLEDPDDRVRMSACDAVGALWVRPAE